MSVVRYDLIPEDDAWVMPTTAKTNAVAILMNPDTDINVKASKRAGFEDGAWEINLQDSEQIFAMVAEDTAEA